MLIYIHPMLGVCVFLTTGCLERKEGTMHTLKRISLILIALMLATMLPPWGSRSLSGTAQAACPVTAGNWHEVGADSACAGGISNNSGGSGNPSLALAPNGTPYVGWSDSSGGDTEIYVRRWNGSGWEEVGGGSASGGGISNNSGGSSAPSLDIAPDGTTYVAWQDSTNETNWDIYVRRWNGSNWEEVGAGSASGGGISNDSEGSRDPSLAIAPDGTPYVVWGDDSLEIYVRRWNGSSWEEVGTGSATGGGISDNSSISENPWLAIAPDGTPYVAWEDYGGGYRSEIYMRRWNGSSWEEVGAGSASGGGISNTTNSDSGGASVAVAPDGTPYVTWNDYIGGENLEIYVRRWNGSSWEEVGAGSASGGGISDNSGWSAGRSVAVAPDGTPYVAWGDDSISPFYNSEIYVRRWQPDIGFRPNPHGYQFPNYGGVNFDDYTIDDMRRMFGDAAVCHRVEPACDVRPAARQWNAQANQSMNGGHCDGMASTSLRFFKGMDNLSDLQGGANTTHDLQLGNARRHIAYYFVEQLTNPVKAYKEQVRQNPPSAILNQWRSAMSGGAPDPTTLFVRQAGQGGHAITPYAIEDRGNGVYWVRVYDNSEPDDANRYVEINTTNDTWSSNLSGRPGTWNGDANTHTLGVVPISKYAEQPVCPWCSDNGASTLSGSPSGQVWLSGQGHLLITDAQGRRIGYEGDQFVNEVPGAYESIVDGGLGIEMEPIYTLPLSDTHTILLDGQTLTQTETVEVTQFGRGHAAWVDDVTLGPTSQDELIIAADGMQLAYQPSSDQEATLTLALDGASESNQLQVNRADIGAGQVVTLTADVGNGQLMFNNMQAGGGEYDLEVKRVSAAGEQTFAHPGLAVSATDTHYVDYGAWDGSGPMTLHIDHGSDGTIDETLVLDNQAPQAGQIYLPIITKSY
jgi:hypothetical protein